MAGAPKGNTNAEKYDLETAKQILNDAIDLSNQKEDLTIPLTGKKQNGYSFDFIGEIAGELNTYHELLTRDLPSRHNEVKPLSNQLIRNMERNCYSNTKKGLIKEATGIVNLKSNHKWTDRHDHAVNSRNLNMNSELTDEEKQEALNDIKKGLSELNDY